MSLLVVLALAVLGGGGWLWLRDSSLVSVTRVAVPSAPITSSPGSSEPMRRGPDGVITDEETG